MDPVAEPNTVDQLPQLGLHRSEPEAAVPPGSGDNEEIVGELAEEVGGREEGQPAGRTPPDVLETERGLATFGLDQGTVGGADVDSGVHLGQTGGDDGHAVVPALTLPHHLLDVDWIRPVPAAEDDEKSVDCVDEIVLVALSTDQLTGLGHQNGPGGPAKESQNLRINAVFLGPDLHHSQHPLEDGRSGNQSQDLTGGPVAVQAAETRGLQVSADGLRHQEGLVSGDGEGGGDPGHGEVHLHPSVVHLDDGDVGCWQLTELRDFLLNQK